MTLAADSTAPAFGRGYRYLLPTDYIRLATINDEKLPETDYEIEDGYLVCDFAPPINVRYVFDQEIVTKFSPKFVMLFSTALAQVCAYDMTGNRSMVEEMRMQYANLLTDAGVIEAQSNPPKTIRRSKWSAARLFGYVTSERN